MNSQQDHIALRRYHSMCHYRLVRTQMPPPKRRRYQQHKLRWSGTRSLICRLGAKREFVPKQTSDLKLKTNRLQCTPQRYGVVPLEALGVGRTLAVDEGRAVLQGCNVKDDTGCQAVFAEQGASASQLTAAKVCRHHIPSTWNGWRSERRSLNLHTNQILRRLTDCQGFPRRNAPQFG